MHVPKVNLWDSFTEKSFFLPNKHIKKKKKWLKNLAQSMYLSPRISPKFTSKKYLIYSQEGSWIFLSIFLFPMEYSLEFRSAISQLLYLTHTDHLYLASFMLLWNLTPKPFLCRVSLQTSFCFFLSFTFLSFVLSDTKELWSALGKWARYLLDACTSLNFNGFFKKD